MLKFEFNSSDADRFINKVTILEHAINPSTLLGVSVAIPFEYNSVTPLDWPFKANFHGIKENLCNRSQ